MHAVRDNLKIDLRESAPDIFQVPARSIISPAIIPPLSRLPKTITAIPVYVRDGEPDLTDAAMSRAAEMAMVAFDNNAPESQYLQGWLMQDRFLMHGALGAVYEFLWANPYQPGLSYFHIPLVFHDAATGHVFARTSWDEDATWIGYFDGHLQLFQRRADSNAAPRRGHETGTHRRRVAAERRDQNAAGSAPTPKPCSS